MSYQYFYYSYCSMVWRKFCETLCSLKFCALLTILILDHLKRGFVFWHYAVLKFQNLFLVRLQKKDLLSQVILRNFKKEVTTPPLAKQITTGLMIKMLIFVRGIMLLLSLLLFCSFLATKSGFWPTKERADSNFLE